MSLGFPGSLHGSAVLNCRTVDPASSRIHETTVDAVAANQKFTCLSDPGSVLSVPFPIAALVYAGIITRAVKKTFDAAA